MAHHTAPNQMLQPKEEAQELLAKPNLTHTAQNAANQYPLQSSSCDKIESLSRVKWRQPRI